MSATPNGVALVTGARGGIGRDVVARIGVASHEAIAATRPLVK